MWQLDLSAEPWSWKRIKPHGNGPEPRRRQALCQVVSIFAKLKIWKKVKAHYVAGSILTCILKLPFVFLQGSRLFLFGGTSPYHGPPIDFTPAQLELMPEQGEAMDKLMDHSDMFVLDLNPSLKTLCLMTVIANSHKLDYRHELPQNLVTEINNMTVRNSISKPLPLKTLPLGQ